MHSHKHKNFFYHSLNKFIYLSYFTINLGQIRVTKSCSDCLKVLVWLMSLPSQIMLVREKTLACLFWSQSRLSPFTHNRIAHLIVSHYLYHWEVLKINVLVLIMYKSTYAWHNHNSFVLLFVQSYNGWHNYSQMIKNWLLFQKK
jgi:hypothetical protein